MTIRIDEASLLRAGFPRDLVAALRDLATLSASSVTPADLTALQVQINANDAELAAFEKQILIRRISADVSNLVQSVEQLRAQVAALPKPNNSALIQRIDHLEQITAGLL
jgi:hypothetical protein